MKRLPRRALRLKTKLLEKAVLASLLAKEKRRGKTVVFTNGVYDLIHAGHVTLLEKSKRLGDILVVGINSDASVRRLKGPRRPLAGQKDRALVLSALSAVDYVAIFGEDTPYELIQTLRPDILVKGGDYALGQIVGRDLVKKVVRIPLVKGRSTSHLIAKILKAYGPR
jgi:D-beta-D-heptose 7-phosphate kinase/D-beta-D-heptose 1-phosphate adenosyltransferase